MVWLGNTGVVDTMVLSMARGVASRIFKDLEVKVRWNFGKPKLSTRCDETIGIIFDADVPQTFSPKALAYATVSDKNAPIHVFYTRMFTTYSRSLLPDLLGHVMAHEITHVIQGNAQHSGQGLMKAKWDARDCSKIHSLYFAEEDAAAIRGYFDGGAQLISQKRIPSR
jgi:hypothetical protein